MYKFLQELAGYGYNKGSRTYFFGEGLERVLTDNIPENKVIEMATEHIDMFETELPHYNISYSTKEVINGYRTCKYSVCNKTTNEVFQLIAYDNKYLQCYDIEYKDGIYVLTSTSRAIDLIVKLLIVDKESTLCSLLHCLINNHAIDDEAIIFYMKYIQYKRDWINTLPNDIHKLIDKVSADYAFNNFFYDIEDINWEIMDIAIELFSNIDISKLKKLLRLYHKYHVSDYSLSAGIIFCHFLEANKDYVNAQSKSDEELENMIRYIINKFTFY